MRYLISIVIYMMVSATAFAVAVDPNAIPDPKKEAIARAVMKEIRCLVCQNQSIEDSNAELALDLRSLIREQVIEGKTPDQIKAFLVERYGDWVLLAPPVKPSTYFLWASPFLVLLLAVFMVFMRRQTPATPTPLSKTEQEKLQSLLQEKGGKE